MVIKASSAGPIASLIADLGSDDAVTREAAIARLTVFGPRAVARLIPIVTASAQPAARVAALRALEAIADARALDHVLAATGSNEPDVAAAAIRAARPFLRAERGADVVDHLTRMALNGSVNEDVRVAALETLRTLEASTVKPLITALKKDKNAAVRAALEPIRDETPRETAEVALTRAAVELPERPDELVVALEAAGATIPATTLLALIERVSAREGQLTTSRRAKWTDIRGRAHLALATRRSRVALFELRESLERARTPLPSGFLAALSKIGDSSCLDAIAAAYAHSVESPGVHGKAWQAELGEAFRSIVKREKLTKRHAVIRKIEKRWGRALPFI